MYNGLKKWENSAMNVFKNVQTRHSFAFPICLLQLLYHQLLLAFDANNATTMYDFYNSTGTLKF